MVIACDCVYNEALVQPLVDIMADACRLKESKRDSDGDGDTPTIVLVAQELRSPDVFDSWFEAFHERFHTYRIPDRYLSDELKPTAGYALYVGVLRNI